MPTTANEQGRVFREAWIAGVTKYFPGEPKPGYVTPWEDTPEWERRAAAAVHDNTKQPPRYRPLLPGLRGHHGHGSRCR
jgi:hypothetical protein